MIIGITGGIASGKSTFCGYLRQKDYHVISADEISHQITEKKCALTDAAADLLGEECLSEDGSLDRIKTAELIFADKKKADAFNSIMHPAILAEIKKQVDDIIFVDPKSIVFVEVPLLFEAGWGSMFDKVILVVADKNTRMNRACSRSAASPEDIEARMRLQMSDDEKSKYSDYVISNNGSISDLYRQADKILNDLDGR